MRRAGAVARRGSGDSITAAVTIAESVKRVVRAQGAVS